MLEKPWVAKLFAFFDRKPRYRVYRADLLLPEWTWSRELRGRYHCVPHFTLLKELPPYDGRDEGGTY
jgi:hypothetical protein